MNKGIYSLFALSFFAVLTGCNSQNGSVVPTPAENNTTPTPVQTVIVKGEEFSPDAILEKLNAKKQQFATGWNPNTDIWVISVQEVKLRKGMSEAEAADIAAIKKINNSDPKFQSFVNDAKAKIIEYYNSKCDFIINEAQMLSDKSDYDQAMYKHN